MGAQRRPARAAVSLLVAALSVPVGPAPAEAATPTVSAPAPPASAATTAAAPPRAPTPATPATPATGAAGPGASPTPAPAGPAEVPAALSPAVPAGSMASLARAVAAAPGRPVVLVPAGEGGLPRELLEALTDALADEGLGEATLAAAPAEGEAALPSLSEHGWALLVSLDRVEGAESLRVAAVPPGSRVTLVGRAPRDAGGDARAVALLVRDLARTSRPAERPCPPAPDSPTLTRRARSAGRPALALTGAALGGYVGYSLQRASGSTDARLTYPLLALGTGLGLGAAMVVSDEWDIGVGEAWYLSAAATWPAVGLLLIEPGGADRPGRFLEGAGASAGGLALGVAAVATGPVSEGGALLAHSGGVFGTMLGGVTALAVEGDTRASPTTGMGAGAIAGVLAGGVAGRFAPAVAGARVLLVDLGGGLGALGGAALGSPLIFGEDVEGTRTRLWLSGIAAGTLVGAGVALAATAGAAPGEEARGAPRLLPFAGAIAAAPDPRGRPRAVQGVGVRGSF